LPNINVKIYELLFFKVGVKMGLMHLSRGV